MLVVGIDVSKNKSTVAILDQSGKCLRKPFEVEHCKSSFNALVDLILSLDQELKIVMESTSIYHLPIVYFLKSRNLFVSVVNPLVLKKWRTQNLRPIKTDKQDSIAIAKYGCEKWFSLKNFSPENPIYSELKILGRQYAHYMELHISALQELNHIIDQTMPGIKTLFPIINNPSGKNKFADFVEKYLHYSHITSFSESDFIDDYNSWAKQSGYFPSSKKAKAVYSKATDSIPFIPFNKTTQFLILEAVRVLREIDSTLHKILSQMIELARTLPEYTIVKSMRGVGDKLAVKLIAEIGDIRRFRSGKSLIAYAGIDVIPYQSGNFKSENRKISKRGSSLLRKIGYEVMMCVKAHKPKVPDSIYDFIVKKESEGKAKRVAKIAGLNKFLRIYYARIKELYSYLGIDFC